MEGNRFLARSREDRDLFAKDILCAFLRSPEMMGVAMQQRGAVPLKFLIDEAVLTTDALFAELDNVKS